jgi:F-actin capping protein, beta subunit
MEAALDLMRRISPKKSETALSALLSLLPHYSADLLSQVDLPLQVIILFSSLIFSIGFIFSTISLSKGIIAYTPLII